MNNLFKYLLIKIDNLWEYFGIYTFSGMKRKYEKEINGRCIVSISIDCYWPGIGECRVDKDVIIFSGQYYYHLGKHEIFLNKINSPDSFYFDYIRMLVELRGFKYLLDKHYFHELSEGEDYFVSGFNERQVEVTKKSRRKEKLYLTIRPEYEFVFNKVNKLRDFVVYFDSYYKILR